VNRISIAERGGEVVALDGLAADPCKERRADGDGPTSSVKARPGDSFGLPGCRRVSGVVLAALDAT
jgi:hypothetical protein